MQVSRDKSLEDVNHAMKRTLDPLAKGIKEMFVPLRTSFEKTQWFEQSQHAHEFGESNFCDGSEEKVRHLKKKL